MKTETFSGKIETAFGKTLPSPVSFSGSFEAYENYEDIVKANDLLSNEEVLNAVNAKRKAKARAAATTEALQAAGIEKPDTSSPEYVKAQMVKSFAKLYKVSEADASAMLEQAGAAFAK